jgi:hypothetical protein
MKSMTNYKRQSTVGWWQLLACAGACVDGSGSDATAAPNGGTGVAIAEWHGGRPAASATLGDRYIGRPEFGNQDGGARRSLRLGLGQSSGIRMGAHDVPCG